MDNVQKLSVSDAMLLEGNAAIVVLSTVEKARGYLERYSKEGLKLFEAQLNVTHYDKDNTYIDSKGRVCILIHVKLFTILTIIVKSFLPKDIYEVLNNSDDAFYSLLEYDFGELMKSKFKGE